MPEIAHDTAPTLALTLEIVTAPDPRRQFITAMIAATAALKEAHELTSAIAQLPTSMNGQILRSAMNIADALAAGAAADPALVDQQIALAGGMVQGALHQVLAALQLAAASVGVVIPTALEA